MLPKLEEERINLPNAIIQEKAVVGKTLSIYGIEFNKVFNGSNATYKYFYNKDYNPVISVGKKNGTGIWYVVYTLSQADKIVKEIRLQLSYQDRFECMKTKNKIMDNLYNKYGGKYQNQLEIIEKQLSVVSSITHTSRARIDLNDIVIAASCYQDGGYSSNEITIKLNDKSLRKKQDIAIDNL